MKYIGVYEGILLYSPSLPAFSPSLLPLSPLLSPYVENLLYRGPLVCGLSIMRIPYILDSLY